MSGSASPASTFGNCDAVNLVALCNFIHDILSGLILHLAENGVFAVQPIGGNMGDEELAAVGVGACIGHGKRAGLVFAGIIFYFVRKLISRTARAGAGRVAALNHEVGNDAMEFDSVVKFFAGEEDEIVDG